MPINRTASGTLPHSPIISISAISDVLCLYVDKLIILTFLPPIYASINGLTAIVLIAAVVAIKKGNKKLHEQLTTFAIGCSLLFLLLYIAYHTTSDSTKFGGEGAIKYIYYFILITHIILSIVVIPFVLTTFMRAKLGNFPQHKKIAKITFPLWLYVAITGVVVYLMISPYYV